MVDFMLKFEIHSVFQLMPCDPNYVRPAGELTVRFCYVDFDVDKAIELVDAGDNGGKSDEQLLKDWGCDKILEGVQALVKFVEEYGQ